MSKALLRRPHANEHAESHLVYVNKVPGEDILGFLQTQLEATRSLFSRLDPTKGDHRYAAGKWSVKEVLGHIIDTERVFSYRLVTFARGDQTALPGFDQDVWAQHANYSQMPIADLAEEFEAVRHSTIVFLKHLAPEARDRRGTANGKQVTARAIAFMVGGHAQHHLDILKERYHI